MVLTHFPTSPRWIVREYLLRPNVWRIRVILRVIVNLYSGTELVLYLLSFNFYSITLWDIYCYVHYIVYYLPSIHNFISKPAIILTVIRIATVGPYFWHCPLLSLFILFYIFMRVWVWIFTFWTFSTWHQTGWNNLSKFTKTELWTQIWFQISFLFHNFILLLQHYIHNSY